MKLVGIDLDPSLRLMFRGNMIVQGHKLTITLKAVVNRLVRLEELGPAEQSFERRHAGYGVTDEHCETLALADVLL